MILENVILGKLAIVDKTYISYSAEFIPNALNPLRIRSHVGYVSVVQRNSLGSQCNDPYAVQF